MQTIYKLIKLNRLLGSHRLKFATAWAAHHLGIRHLSIRLDPVMACNLRCSMCYFSNPDYVQNVRGIFSEEEIERIAGMFFPKAIVLVIGCGTEPTLYKNFPELVRIAKRYKVPNVGFTTNGQLLKEHHIERFVQDRLDELTISVHGVEKVTYEKFMLNASFETLHAVLQTLDEVKKKHASLLPNLRLNYTVNPENINELAHFFEVFGRYTITTLQIRPIMDFHGQYRNVLTSRDMDMYRTVLDQLRHDCRTRGVTYLANTSDPMFEFENTASVILQAVHRRITPMEVWRSEFNWRTETYDQFCRRIAWSSYLFKSIFSNIHDVMKHNAGAWAKHSATYEVNF